MQCPDIPADTTTGSTILIGQSNSEFGFFDICDSMAEEVDTDWHRVTLEYGKTYLFFATIDGTAVANRPEFTFHDRFGNLETEFDNSGAQHFRYTARYSGRHYVSISQGSLLNGTTYAIDAHELKDDTKGAGPTIKLVDGFAKMDEIEVVGDTDTFDFEVFADRAYKFIVVGDNGGQTLATPAIELYRDGSLIGNGSNFLAFNAAVRETLQVQVGGEAGTGTYQVIGIVDDDAGQDTATTSELVFTGNLASKEGYVSEFQDFDWHKVELTAGDIVKVRLTGVGLEFLPTPNLVIRDPGLTVLHGQGIRVPSDDAVLEHVFKAETTGTHYVVARTKIDSFNGAYNVSVEKIRTPASENNLFGRGETSRLLFDKGASIPLADLISLDGLDPFAYEVYSSVPLLRDGNVMSADQQYGIIAGNIGLWSVEADQVSDLGELMLRAVVTGDWSEWQKFALAPASFPDDLVATSIWEGTDPITYRFVATRPSEYGESEFGTFKQLGEFGELRTALTESFDAINTVTQLNFVAGTAGQEADINIFGGTAVGQPFVSFFPGTGRGGDMIFNEADFSAEVGDVERLRMLRALGTSLGLNFTGGERQDTLMGSGLHPKDLVPGTFGKHDWAALQDSYGSIVRDPEAGISPLQNFVLTADPVMSTIAREARNILVGDDVLDQNFNIDLRDGQVSSVRDAAFVASEVTIGYGAQVHNAAGGNGDDFIFGNGLANVLQGGDGDDFLTGYENDDTMVGGEGDDTFVHYFGDGNDVVSDEGGVDTLCFIGRGPFENERLIEDFEFTRDGRFLDVSLTLDGGPQDGFVRIDTGINNNNLIESLELWHEGALRDRISLFNLYNSMTDGETSRFNVLATSDNFGRLVSPA